MAETATAAEPKTYYSTSAALKIRITRPVRVMTTHGATEMVEGKEAQFVPLGQWSNYGSFTTDDPEIQHYLEKQIAEGRGDIMHGDQFNERITPDDKKVSMLRNELGVRDEQVRLLIEQNRLLKEEAERERARRNQK